MAQQHAEPGWQREGPVRGVVLDAQGRTVLRALPRPEPAPGEALVRTLLVGLDGTDDEVVRGGGEPPEGEEELVLGHEALGEVVEAPAGSGLFPGDLVVPMVRQGCSGCAACVREAPDLCETDGYRERGIKGLHGFARDVWSEEPRNLVPAPAALGELAVLAEPLAVLVKALRTAAHLQQRIPWFEREGGFRGQRALVAGTGSLGILGVFLLRHEGMEVWSLDRSPHDAAAPRLAADLGARHVNAEAQDLQEIATEIGGFDLVLEATGAPKVAFDAMQGLAKNGVLCLLGVPAEKPPFPVDGDEILRRAVMGNQAVLGSVNAGREHVEEALRLLHAWQGPWNLELGRVFSHRFRPEEHERAFAASGPDVIKRVIDWR